MERIEYVINDLAEWLKRKVEEAGAKGLVFGLSGGIDSAVMGGISKLAFPDTSLGIIMPCYSPEIDKEHALLVADSLNLDTKTVDLDSVFDKLLKIAGLGLDNKLAIANIKPRLRMTTLYYFAQNYNYLVAGPSNKSEFITGYFTKYGDSGVDLLPLADFIKTEIWEIAKYLNIPQVIIEKEPTAGLWEDQTDENEMGFSYKLLDHYIVTGKGPEKVVNKINAMYKASRHKRGFPPIYSR